MSAPTWSHGRRIAATLVLALLAGASAAQTPASSTAASADGLGRLFFTPERRQELDRRRQSPLPPSNAADSTAAYRIDGVVTRSSGKRTVWINVSVQPAALLPDGQR